MKDKLLRDIEIKLSLQFDTDQREKIMRTVISCLNDYDVTKRTTDLTVRSEDINERLLKRYAACLAIDGLAKGTIMQYVRTLRKLGGLIEKPYTEMSAYDIRFFLADIKARGSKNSHVENQRAYVSAFYQWMFSEEIIEKNPCLKIKPIKVEKEIRFPFSPVEIDKMRTSCKRELDRAIIETLLSSGVRCEELCNLDRADVDLEKNVLHVRLGKGSKDRVVYINDVAAEHIKIYLSKRKDDSPALFVSQTRKERFTEGGIKALVNRIGIKSEVENVHPHRFRRTFATEMYRRGMDINTIRKLMGHSSVATTQRYIYTADEQLQSEYRKYSA